jgi:hypothetical protein
MVNSFRDVVELWRTPEVLAAEIGASHWAVHKWRQRDAIPAEWWARLLQTKIARRHSLNADLLAKLADRTKVA